MSFKEDNRIFQEMVKELHLLRANNKKLAKEHNGYVDGIFLFSEACLTLSCFERFLRIVPWITKGPKDTFYNLIEKAVSNRLKLTVHKVSDLISKPETKSHLDNLGITTDQQLNLKIAHYIVKIRNLVLHANFEQINGLEHPLIPNRNQFNSINDYFKSSKFISDVECIYEVLDLVVSQVNSETGELIS